MKIRVLFASAILSLVAASAQAKPFQEMFPGKTYQTPEENNFVQSLDYKEGKIALGAGGVQLNVPKNFYYLSPEDTKRVLVDAWGNPSSTAVGVLGMILPANKTPLDDAWAAVIQFDEDGYVSDEDATSVDYNELLEGMQAATEENNKERVQQGFSRIRLVGWASPPYYDKATHKLHWAKELEFSDSPELHTLNYDVRALGRKGVLSMNFIADMQQINEIKSVIPAVVAMPEFESGSRYEDYVPGADKVAAYGLGGLIAGKLAAKTGLFVIALAFLKKAWIFVLIGLGGAWQIVSRLFRRTPES